MDFLDPPSGKAVPFNRCAGHTAVDRWPACKHVGVMLRTGTLGRAVAFNKEKVMDAARRFVDKGQIDKAVKEYLRIVQEDPKDVRVWLKIGDLYEKKGSKQEAIETYAKVARFYHEQGFFLKAVAVYKQILKLDG